MSSTPYPIYLISLEGDTPRRESLATRFPGYYPHMIMVPAVNGNALSADVFFNHIIDPVARGHRLMLPGEVGCSLSHIEALRLFLSSGAEAGLILEDDVLGDDAAIDRVMTFIAALPPQGFLVCGGQEGMPAARKYLLGKATKITGLYELSTYSIDQLFRACCYAVTRCSARQILTRQEQWLRLADDWPALLKDKDIDLYFCRELSHPKELSNSHLQGQRLLFGHNSILGKRVGTDRLRHRLTRIKRKLGALYCLLRGYRRVA